MATKVKCQLILQAADERLDADDASTPNTYPNRAVVTVPGELHPLVEMTQHVHVLPSEAPEEFRDLASRLLRACGSEFAVDPQAYASGHIEVSGHWQKVGAGSLFSFSKDGRPYVERRPAVDPNCVCRYLIGIQTI